MKEPAEHHNRVSVYFKGDYPGISSELIVKQFGKDVEEGKSRIAVIEDQGIPDYLVVLRHERDRGYGDALMKRALNTFAECGVRTIEIKVIYGNDAVDFYRKYGFRKKMLYCA